MTTREDQLEAALKAMLQSVCGPTGFAEAVRHNSGLSYPWHSLDAAEAQAITALSTPATEPQGYVDGPIADFVNAMKTDDNVARFMNQRICCDGHMCGCMAATVGEYLDHCAQSPATIGATDGPATAKPLEWYDRGYEWSWWADTSFGIGTYQIRCEGGIGYLVDFDGVTIGDPHDTLELAKSAAQSDYNRRILSALAASPAPQPAADTRVVVKPLVWEAYAQGEISRQNDVHPEYCTAPSVSKERAGEWRLRGPWIGFNYYPTKEAAKTAAQNHADAAHWANTKIVGE